MYIFSKIFVIEQITFIFKILKRNMERNPLQEHIRAGVGSHVCTTWFAPPPPPLKRLTSLKETCLAPGVPNLMLVGEMEVPTKRKRKKEHIRSYMAPKILEE